MDIKIKLCGECGNKGSYESYYRMHSPCKKCSKDESVFTIKLMGTNVWINKDYTIKITHISNE